MMGLTAMETRRLKKFDVRCLGILLFVSASSERPTSISILVPAKTSGHVTL